MRFRLIIAPCFLHTEDLRNGRYVLPEVFYKHILTFTSAKTCISLTHAWGRVDTHVLTHVHTNMHAD